MFKRRSSRSRSFLEIASFFANCTWRRIVANIDGRRDIPRLCQMLNVHSCMLQRVQLDLSQFFHFSQSCFQSWGGPGSPLCLTLVSLLQVVYSQPHSTVEQKFRFDPTHWMNTVLAVFTVFPPNKGRKGNFHLPCARRQMKKRWMTTRTYFYLTRQTIGAAQVLSTRKTSISEARERGSGRVKNKDFEIEHVRGNIGEKREQT